MTLNPADDSMVIVRKDTQFNFGFKDFVRFKWLTYQKPE